ncbi:MAG TPA: sensor domain-containing diguanylate cyclase, partial [Candidatus Deferrimicrobium sp.]|nr:sensor domain-containing diguanylate cyclase [Candidatus Deferrimicrobium sp.]
MTNAIHTINSKKLIENTELVKLHEFGLILNSTHNIDQIVRESAAAIQSIMKADGCHILFVQGVVDELKLETAIHHGGKPFPQEVDETKGISGMAFSSGETVLVSDAETDPRVTREIQRYLGHKSMVSVPICAKEETIGVVSVYSSASERYTQRHGEFLKMLASHLGLAIENARQMVQLQNAAFTDPLTGAYNHRYFRNELEYIIDKQSDSLVSLIMLDLNDLKIINDTFGHTKGDFVLQQIALALKKNVRGMDIVSRYGGDEFAVILPGADTEEALLVAQRMETAVAERCILEDFQVTVS